MRAATARFGGSLGSGAAGLAAGGLGCAAFGAAALDWTAGFFAAGFAVKKEAEDHGKDKARQAGAKERPAQRA